MTLRLPLSGKRHATIVSAYAPTMTNPDEVKDKLYDDLDSMISVAPRTDKLILLEVFNARVGTGHPTWEGEGVIGSEGVGKCNSNGILLLRKCAEHELLITNTVFHLQTRRKTSWMHPRSKHWHLIDYVIVRRKNRQDVRVTKTMCGADCWTDHRLVVSKLNLRIQSVRRPQGKKVPKKLDVSKLKQDSNRQAFVNDLCNRLDALDHSSEDVDESWTVFRDTVHSSAIGFLGSVSRKHQDWFDENGKDIQGLLELIEDKHQKHKAYLRYTSSVSSKAAYSKICKTVQARLRDMQGTWLSKKADEIQSLQTERIWKSSLMHSRQYMVPRAQEPPHSLVQMELVFWLTKKLSWKDGLNTLMVSHHLSMMKLSTDYHRWNVIRCCLMSSQPSLKQWKQ